jgi:phosphoribosylaminoimidazolecarboxamide formyltransferase/IMP cyclohydrolase
LIAGSTISESTERNLTVLPVQRALLSVHDKQGLVELARALSALGIELVSSGGTQKHLQAAGLEVIAVSDLTGFPEMLDGRVKTLHPRVHGGILADRSKPEHLAALATHEIGRIDLVVVNLYPFEATIARPGVSEHESVEMIDIGGPAMVRAAGKNFEGVGVVVDPADYGEVVAALEQPGGTLPRELRRRLAAKAFAHTARYDSTVAGWFAGSGPDADVARFPADLTIPLRLEFPTRYGENPHQRAAVYRQAGGRGLLGGMRQLQGKELSWNNLLDADAARKLVALFDEPAVVLVKHNNPCGVGRAADAVQAYRRAFDADPVSAFGGILAVNRPVTLDLVDAFGDLFLEVLVAAEIEDAAAERLAQKKNLRLLLCPGYAPASGEIELRGIDGGFLAQTPDGFGDDPSTWTCATRRQPTASERRALEFAWAVARYTKSNAIVITGEDQTYGVGAGQMSRVDSCRMAIQKARFPLAGSVAASDAFFPFRDGLDTLAGAGVAAVVQPGGSKRDDELLAAADEHGMAMLLTGRRHFRH